MFFYLWDVIFVFPNYFQAFGERSHSILLILSQVGTLPEASPKKHVKEYLYAIGVIIDI